MEEGFVNYLYKRALEEAKRIRQAKIEEKRNQMKNTFARYCSFSSEYFKQNGVPDDNHPSEMDTFCKLLISFVNTDSILNLFSIIKNALAKEAIYNRGYWHLTDGYLSENNENFKFFANEIDNLTTYFIESLEDFERDGSIGNLNTFVPSCLKYIDEILTKIDEDDLSSYQFVELIMLRQIFFKMYCLKNCLDSAKNLADPS